VTDYESSARTATPDYYCVIGRRIRFIQTPSGTYSARIWFLRSPEKFMLEQGRIGLVNTSSNYVLVDEVGSDLTTESDQLGSYVNIVDGQTGEIRGTLQIQILGDNRITFRTTPTRTTVLNRTVGTTLTGLGAAADDYICSVEGTCVPYYSQPTRNFLVQYAVAELTRKLGGAADMEERVLERFERQIEKSFVSREHHTRVQKRSSIWSRPVRRLPWE